MATDTQIAGPRLAGRRDHLDALDAHYRSASGGRGCIVLVTGEPGIGKSRLVREFAAELDRSRGAEVVTGRCYDHRTPAPFGPFQDVLQELIGRHGPEAVRGRAGAHAADLARLAPELGDAPPAAGEPPYERRRIFEGIRRVLGAAAPGRCSVAVLEDLHWSDPATLDLLQYLARAVEDSAVLVLATCRTAGDRPPALLAPLLEQLRRARRHHELRLAPLRPDELSQMLEGIAGDRVPPHVGEAIHERSQGNPFFAEEIFRSVLGNAPPGRWLRHARAGAPVRPAGLPASIRSGILARVDALDGPTREVLRDAAVIGRRFDFDLLQRLSGRTEARLLRALERLVELDFLVEDPAGPPDRYAFRHALIQEAVYGALLARDRGRRHRELLRALDEPRPAAPRPAAGAHELTPRELEVLRLVAAGETNRDIARRSFVSTSTVKTHVHHILAKLGARSRTRAVARARELGLLPR